MWSSTLAFRNRLGLFYYDRYKSIVAAIINLLASIVLGNMFGMLGIFLGTFVCTLSTSFWVEPHVLYQRCFGKSVWEYFGKYFIYAFSTAILWFICDCICSKIKCGSILLFLLKAVISFVIVNVGFWIIFSKSQAYDILQKKAFSVIEKRFRSQSNEHING